MTQDELISRLAPVRVPQSFAQFGLQDGLLAVGLGLLSGVLAMCLVRTLTRPRLNSASVVQQKIVRLAALSPQARLTGLAELSRDLGGELSAEAQRALYDPNISWDPVALEAAITAQARNAKV